MKLAVRTACAAALVLTASAQAQVHEVQPPCDRACLSGYMDRYLAAQAAGDAAGLPFDGDVRLTENGVEVAAGEGLFVTAGEPTYRLDVVDPEFGGIASHLVVREGDGHAFQMLRLKVADGRITEVESVFAREGESGPMWVPDFATEPRAEFLLSIGEADRNSRLELMAIADAYWRALETNGRPDYRPVPMLPGLLRIENGRATSGGARQVDQDLDGVASGMLGRSASEQFAAGVFASRTVYDRRFPVVDVERGVVLSIARMGLDDGHEMPAHWQGGRPILTELFAIQAGVITAIDVVMNSTVPLERSSGWPRDRLTRSKSDPD